VIQRGLKVTTTTTTTESTQTTIKRTVEYKGGPELLFAEYVLVDRYALFRRRGGREDAVGNEELGHFPADHIPAAGGE
jgi:hypothetical protein